ncbi:MAG TPA: tetratricopeptide repeat protein [Bryobacteraceae bacterium]|nr:tetratricopeptide repeat protein [Bryobacteraceae bacterium]
MMNPTQLRDLNLHTNDLITAGKFAEAEKICRQILQDYPRDPTALGNLGIVATHAGQLQAAVDLLRRAIAGSPWSAWHYYNLSDPLRRLGQLDDAAAALREAIDLEPKMVTAYVNLGWVMAQKSMYDEATAAFQKAAELAPDDARIQMNLGHALRRRQEQERAIFHLRRALELDPNLPEAWAMLGSALREAGQIGQAIESFRKAITLNPSFREAHSNLCYAMYFDPALQPAEILAEHRAWAAKFAEPLASAIQTHANDRNPDRPLRIGYVSHDLSHHVVGWFMEPILRNHDRDNYHVICYATGRADDELSQRLREHVRGWRIAHNMNDEQLAQLIRQDQIDVLIDLTLHMRGSRLPMFARRPAPVQITHLAYCGTSGMTAINWCITDPQLSPEGLNDSFFTEKLLRLDGSYWCYEPSADSPPAGPLPAASRGYVTFGSLNAFSKTNDQLIQLWRDVLDAVPNSRLVIHALGGDENQAARKRFSDTGIDPARLTLVGRQSRNEYLNQYNAIDIALDPIPYGGGTTSLDALWMGVPVITLAGTLPVGRTGVTLLNQLGLNEWIAQTPQQYIQLAARLAGDLPRLAELRQNLRQTLSKSILMDAPRYVRSLESAYRSAWKKWCASAPK